MISGYIREVKRLLGWSMTKSGAIPPGSSKTRWKCKKRSVHVVLTLQKSIGLASGTIFFYERFFSFRRYEPFYYSIYKDLEAASFENVKVKRENLKPTAIYC